MGVLARVAGEGQAREARALRDAEVARIAAEQARRADSARFVVAVDSGRTLSSKRAWQLDSDLHAAPFTVAHDSVHRRVASLRLDSTARILKRAAKNGAYLATARQLLVDVSPPLTASQERRQTALSSELTRLDRRYARLAQQGAARARANQARANTFQPSQPGRTTSPGRSTGPSGASALCRDGTYSYSPSRRGTCSRHGGVAQWL